MKTKVPLVNTDFPVVVYEPLPHSAVDPATQYHVFKCAPISIGTHSSTVSRTITMCIYVLSPNLILIADARHYYPLIINASQAIRVPTSLASHHLHGIKKNTGSKYGSHREEERPATMGSTAGEGRQG